MVAMAIRLVPLCSVDVYHPIRKILPLLSSREPIKTILPRRRSRQADKVERKQFINGFELCHKGVRKSAFVELEKDLE
jgi:hypothetical protein